MDVGAAVLYPEALQWQGPLSGQAVEKGHWDLSHWGLSAPLGGFGFLVSRVPKPFPSTVLALSAPARVFGANPINTRLLSLGIVPLGRELVHLTEGTVGRASFILK